jgi:hypothetical protein
VEQALGRMAELRGPGGDVALGLLPKPFDVEELLEVVQSMVGEVQPAH